MNIKLSSLAAAIALSLGASPVVFGAATVLVDGSSTVYPITEAVAEEFQSVGGGTRVTVGISGTGGGFKRFCRGETDVADASRPILKDEMVACAQGGVKYVELPIAMDALTVVVGKDNTWVDYLTVAELKKMWEPAAQGKIKNWNQIRASFPDVPLALSGAGADSGTFDYFTEAVVGKPKSSRGDYQASEDDNVTVQFVSRNKGALGYFGLAYYEENKDKLRAVPIKATDTSPAVLPSVATVNDGTYQPLARPLFIYVSGKSMQRPEIKKFVEFYLDQGGALATEVGYVNLPDAAYAQAKQNFAAGKFGTGFGGVPEIGVHVEDLLKREGKQ
ncbi:MAG: PstS family phosphate ABC transporter substrate-binding protein [Proteobacteria bacterium]|nr:PstS family phosphate ABC transporter substrate-binding protein [Pseudomonadota bacterium]